MNNNQTITVLMVEDDPGDARLVRALLAEAQPDSFQLVTAGRLLDGLARLARGGIDAILLDLSLPDSQGVQTLTRMLSWAGSVPVIVLTGMDDARLGLEAVQAGAQDYLVKGQLDASLLARALRYAIERQRLVIERDRLIEDLDAFAHTVAHDLKAPLGVMTTYSYLLKKRCDALPEAGEYTRVITQTARSMAKIISDLLLLASVRQSEVATRPLDMGHVVAGALERLEHLVKECEGQVALPDCWPPAVGHGPWIEAVWVNYVANALKYGGRPPQVELGATAEGDGMVCFWVRDNGPGLEPEAQARLFTPFTRLDQIDLEGPGLGLSIVRRIVEKLGGRVGVESAPGLGSRFYFTLPEPPVDPAGRGTERARGDLQGLG
ncbi:MAG: HAMP domain-containing histidine kinase [Chloroflexi bacterium]|nr:HAMP domain-containing histidine kinase [Chloroflexota bacterium]MCI0644429.1 HAMP domain-containing histidine kinase [Chloroflexota bacterium]MCI0725406.1 HAMP domain-containing histidine kinase [Chloroflexota bacterium]